MIWTEDQKEELKMLFKEQGMSYKDISLHYEKLGIVLSRSAVAGQLRRQGVIRGDGIRLLPPRRKTPKANDGRSRKKGSKGPTFVEEEAVPEGITLMQLQKDSCRWPSGHPDTPEFSFCGKRVTKRPYCDAHQILAYNQNDRYRH